MWSKDNRAAVRVGSAARTQRTGPHLIGVQQATSRARAASFVDMIHIPQSDGYGCKATPVTGTRIREIRRICTGHGDRWCLEMNDECGVSKVPFRALKQSQSHRVTQWSHGITAPSPASNLIIAIRLSNTAWFYL